MGKEGRGKGERERGEWCHCMISLLELYKTGMRISSRSNMTCSRSLEMIRTMNMIPLGGNASR